MIVVAGIAIALAYHAKPQAGSWRRASVPPRSAGLLAARAARINN